MKKMLLTTALLVGASFPTFAAVGVSVSIGEPGFYGQIDLGGAPPPQVIYQQPMVIQQAPAVVAQPIYLRVPTAQRKNWKRYCGRYNACGRPVYFVRNDWYNNVYAPHYRQAHPDRFGPRGHGPGPGQGHPGPGPDHDHGRGHDHH